MYFEIEKQAIDAINKALDQYDVEVDRNFKLEFPPNPNLGDLASTIAFALTKKLKTSPPEVAKGLVEKIEVPEIFLKYKILDLMLIFSLITVNSLNYYWKKLMKIMGNFQHMVKRLYWNTLQQIQMDHYTLGTLEILFLGILFQDC